MIPKSESSEEKKPDEVQRAMDSLRNWFRLLSLGGIVAFCATLVVAVGLWRYQAINTEDRREAIEEERVHRAVQVCVQENDQIERERQFDEEQIIQIFSIFSSSGRDTQDVQERFSKELMAYRTFINESFPYRDCTPECVDAYLDANIEDCPPPKTKPN